MPYALSPKRYPFAQKVAPEPRWAQNPFLLSFPLLVCPLPWEYCPLSVLFLFTFFPFFSFFFHYFFPFASSFFLLSFLSSSFSRFPFLSSFSFSFFSLSSLPFPTQKHYSSHMHVLEDSLACPNLTSIITEKKRCWEPCGCPDLTTCIEFWPSHSGVICKYSMVPPSSSNIFDFCLC